MNRTAYTLTTAGDAGLLREYIAEHYGATLTHGGSGDSMRRAIALTEKLGRMTGLGFDKVLQDVQEDYAAAALDGEEA